MSQLSKRVVDAKIKEQTLDSLTLLIKDLNTIEDTEKFISSILSDIERLMIAKRIAAAFLLRHNIESK